MKNIDLKAKFQDYFHEQEGGALRSERFYDEFQCGILREKRILMWMEAAFIQGARTMAQDTVDTLGDYATSVAGIEDECLTIEQAFDAAKANLMTYYTQILQDAE